MCMWQLVARWMEERTPLAYGCALSRRRHSPLTRTFSFRGLSFDAWSICLFVGLKARRKAAADLLGTSVPLATQLSVGKTCRLEAGNGL